jgi:multidrug resistance protein MdtO
MTATPLTFRRRFWAEALSAELAPYTGRMAGSLRTALAAAIAVSIMLPLQMQGIGNGLYMLLLVSYEQPRLTLRTGLRELIMQLSGIIAALVLIQASGNAPMARVLGVAVFTFMSSFIVRAGRAPAIGFPFCVFSATTLSFWELHLPEKTLIQMSLWPVASGAVAIACAVAIEHLLHVRDPIKRLWQEIDIRLDAVEQLLRLYARSANREQSEPAVRAVTRLAFAGQTKMQALVEEMGERGDFPRAPLVIPMFARLVDLVASLGRQSTLFDAAECARFGRAADVCAALRERRHPSGETPERVRVGEQTKLLDQIEETLDEIATAPEIEQPEPHWQRPEPSDSGLLADAFTNSEYLYFSLRVSLCATLCYVLYNALQWPGLSTAVPTVLITSLGTTGAIKQKQFFRFIGSAIGGVVLGIGAVVFLFPYMDSVTPLVVLVSVVMFASAWIARSPHLGYAGMQMGFAFCLIALSGLSTPVDLSPARDRVAGVGLALIVMWFVFDRTAAVQTTAAMRATLARLLRSVARLLRTNASAPDRRALIVQSNGLRALIANELSTIRKLAEAVPYEFGTDREHELRVSDGILEVTLGAASLTLNVFAMLHDEEYEGAVNEERLAVLHQDLAQQIEQAALAIERRSVAELAQMRSGKDLAAHLDQPRYAEHVQNVIARYREFRAMLPVVVAPAAE